MLCVVCNERIQGTEEFQWVYNSRPGMPPLSLTSAGTSRGKCPRPRRKSNSNEGNGKTDSTLSTKRGSKGKKKTVEVGKDSEQKTTKRWAGQWGKKRKEEGKVAGRS